MKFNRSEYLGAGFFVHPLPLFAVFVLAINDHYLKFAYPSWWAGKLSDFAGLFFFPLFLCALWVVFARIVLRRRNEWLSGRMALTTIIATDLVFAAIKLSPSAALIAEFFLGTFGFPSRIIADPADLIALLVSPLVYLYAIAAERR